MAVAAQVHTKLLDTYYPRILGLAYQALGDAALASRAVEIIFDRIVDQEASGRIAIWRTAVRVLQGFLDRGFKVEPLQSDAAGWQATLLNGLAELDPEARILLILRYHEGLDYSELAEALEIESGRVREEIVSARGRLTDVLRLHDALY